MKLFLISQTQNDYYDTFDSAVVAAEDEDTARNMSPDGNPVADWSTAYSTWCKGPEHVSVKYLGEAKDAIEQGVICASFNAG